VRLYAHAIISAGTRIRRININTRRNLRNISINLHKYSGLIHAVSVCSYFVYASCDMWTLYINQIATLNNNTVLFIPILNYCQVHDNDLCSMALCNTISTTCIQQVKIILPL
jgi:hypothetical protein